MTFADARAPTADNALARRNASLSDPRSDVIFTKEMLLDEPLERTPLRNAGE